MTGASGLDAWTALAELAAAPPFGLAAFVAEHYDTFGDEQRRQLSWLLGRLPAAEAGPALVGLLRRARGATAADLVNTASQARIGLPAGIVLRLFDDPEARLAAIVAAGFVDEERAEVIRRLARELAVEKTRRAAALSLGRLRATEQIPAIVGLLGVVSEFDHESIVVALELMGDPQVVAALRRRIQDAPDRNVFGLHHALRRFTGRDPLLPLGNDEWVPAARAAWSTDHEETPGMTGAEINGDRATFVVRGGKGIVDIDYDPPAPGSSWARWDKSLFVGGDRVYAVSSDCGTCETTLRLIGWPAEPAAERAASIRDRVADVPGLSPELIDLVAPLLRTGHYLVALVDLDLERVGEARESWFLRRHQNGDGDWPGTAHFQVRDRIQDEPPTYAVVLPTQPIDDPDLERVKELREAIRAGRKPAALIEGWIEDRYVEADYPERFLVGIVLDGHHKLLAYTAEQRRARALLVFRIEDSWGPPENRTQWIEDALAAVGNRP